MYFVFCALNVLRMRILDRWLNPVRIEYNVVGRDGEKVARRTTRVVKCDIHKRYVRIDYEPEDLKPNGKPTWGARLRRVGWVIKNFFSPQMVLIASKTGDTEPYNGTMPFYVKSTDIRVPR